MDIDYRKLLTDNLVQIAGKNVLETDSTQLSKLVKVINYLVIQLKVTSGDDPDEQDYVNSVYRNAWEILEKQ